MAGKSKIRRTCCLCGEEFDGYGNNPEPLAGEGSCCDRCNAEKVIPARCEAWRASDEIPRGNSRRVRPVNAI